MSRRTNRLPRRVENDIREALKMVRFGDNAQFGMPRDRVKADHPTDYRDTRKSFTRDEYVKEATRIYRESWIIPKLERVLRWSEGEEE